jgi:hypothetical protein
MALTTLAGVRAARRGMAHRGELRQTARAPSEDSIVGIKFEGEPPFDLGDLAFQIAHQINWTQSGL